MANPYESVTTASAAVAIRMSNVACKLYFLFVGTVYLPIGRNAKCIASEKADHGKARENTERSASKVSVATG